MWAISFGQVDPPPWASSWVPIASTLVGGAIGFASSYGTKLFEDRRQAKALRTALGAEMQALLAITKKRGHVEAFEACIRVWRGGTNEPAPRLSGMEQAFKVNLYDANLQRIGLVGKGAAGEIAAFYMELTAVRITLQAFANGDFDDVSAESKADNAQQALDIWKDAERRARALILKLLG